MLWCARVRAGDTEDLDEALTEYVRTRSTCARHTTPRLSHSTRRRAGLDTLALAWVWAGGVYDTVLTQRRVLTATVFARGECRFLEEYADSEEAAQAFIATIRYLTWTLCHASCMG